MAEFKDLVKYIVRTLWVLLNNLYCIPAHISWLVVLSPIYLVDPAIYLQIEEVLFSWLLTLVACWSWTAQYKVMESGDRLDNFMSKRLLLMPNHQSTADVPMLMTIFSTRVGFCNKVMWIMDKVFKFTNFGVVSWMHDDFFILAGRGNRDSTLVELKQHLMRVWKDKHRRFMVLFPEGGFLRKRKTVSQAFAKKKDLPVLEHCTVPRTGALDVILDTDACDIDKVVDMTIAYPEGRPLDLQSILTGWREPCTTHVHYRVFDCKELTKLSSEERFSWMVNLYKEKDEMLAKFYSTGEFPYSEFTPDAKPPLEVEHDPIRFIVLHLFFLASSYVFYRVFSTILFFVGFF